MNSDMAKQPEPPASGANEKNLKTALLFGGGLVLILFLLGVVPRLLDLAELKQAHEQTVGAVPVVHTVVAHPAPNVESLTLPANVGAILYTTIYARVDGYLSSRMVDIGDVVKKGQLLAVIDTPTVDQKVEQGRADLKKAQADLAKSQAQLKQAESQLMTAKADVEKTQANLNYALVTVKRWQDLCYRGAVSQQSRDEKVRFWEAQTAQLKAVQANEVTAEANVKAAQSQVAASRASVVANVADVRRLEAEQGFQKVTAPFEGVITLRKVDPGALITQGSQTSNLELFQMANIDRLRVYVSAPQRVARYLRPGINADIMVSEFPERHFIGTVTNVSGALDPNTRTRQTEIQIENKDHSLLPGMYAEVKLSGVRETPWIRVPGTTIVTHSDGLYVVDVTSGKVHYQKVTLGRDFGDVVEIRVGLKDGAVVVVSPSDDLLEGEPVQCIKAPKLET